MADLVLGPQLRRVDATSAVVWVETDTPCEVRVGDARARTFSVHGHHYALVDVTGLTPGTATPYTVALDGEQVWPLPDAPASHIRTPDPEAEVRVLFGSCRRVGGHEPDDVAALGPDALRAYARRLAGDPGAEWPTVLLLGGDQVYADAETPGMDAFIRERRDPDEPPGYEIADFEEYAHLYRLSFADPDVRWLLSTVPTLMIFDDHDIRDDWNTSQAWLDEIRAQPWWQARITGGLAAYAVYQHLGNLPADERADDPLWKAVQSGDLDGFVRRVDAEPSTYRWSYHQDFGGTRLIVVDARCARVLTPGAREMLDPGELAWLDDLCTGDRDHLLIATSLPFLMPPAAHDLEAWTAAVADGAWGAWARGPAERLRRKIDLEHWAAFHRSHTTVSRIITEAATGKRGRAPSTVIFLSGDVHHSYLTSVPRPDGRWSRRRYGRSQVLRSAVHQAVCSPIRNPLPAPMRYANTLAARAPIRLLLRSAARLAGVHRPPWRWRVRSGPWFSNALATVRLTGERAAITWETPDQNATTLTPIRGARLSG